jgi:hypothetical protein
VWLIVISWLQKAGTSELLFMFNGPEGAPMLANPPEHIPVSLWDAPM